MQIEWEKLSGGFTYRAPAPLFGNIIVESYGPGDTWSVNWSVPGYCERLIGHDFQTAAEARKAATEHIAKSLTEYLR